MNMNKMFGTDLHSLKLNLKVNQMQQAIMIRINDSFILQVFMFYSLLFTFYIRISLASKITKAKQFIIPFIVDIIPFLFSIFSYILLMISRDIYMLYMCMI